MGPKQPDKRLHELEQKWLDRTITPDEAREYADWYNSGPEAPVEIPGSFAKSDAELEKRMLAKILINTGLAKPLVQLRKRRWLLKLSAAAMIVSLTGIGAWFYLSEPAAKETVKGVSVKALQNDVSPGKGKATLTLADGSTILLDNATNGMITRQGNTKIIKLSNGQLKYTVTGAANDQVMLNTMRTPRGGEYQLTLPDGTQVWLNSASSITYPTAFSGSQRKISITGEAYFEVAKDKSKAFQVNIAGRGKVEVFGTHFNINAFSDEPGIYITLVEGAVKVSNKQQELMMKPGEQAVIDQNQKLILHKHVDTEEVIAWKNGYFVFNNATLGMIMRQVQRWYDVDVVYEGDIQNERFVGKVPRSENASKLIKVLELTHTVKFNIIGKKIIIKPYK